MVTIRRTLAPLATPRAALSILTAAATGTAAGSAARGRWQVAAWFAIAAGLFALAGVVQRRHELALDDARADAIARAVGPATEADARARLLAALGPLTSMSVLTDDRTQVVISGPMPADWQDSIRLDRAPAGTDPMLWEWTITCPLDPSTYRADLDGTRHLWWVVTRADGSHAAIGGVHGPLRLYPSHGGITLTVLVQLVAVTPPPVHQPRL